MDNSNKICNPKTSVPTGKSLNDKDYLNCLLSTLKEMVKNYSVALTEASNKNLYNNYKIFGNFCQTFIVIWKEKRYII